MQLIHLWGTACLQYFQNQEKRVKIVGVELESAPAMSLSLTQMRLNVKTTRREFEIVTLRNGLQIRGCYNAALKK